MSADTVTPIRAGSEPKTKAPRAPRKCYKFYLIEPATGEPDNARLIEALHGVCDAIEKVMAEENDFPRRLPLELGTAAEILSNMLIDRIDAGIG